MRHVHEFIMQVIKTQINLLASDIKPGKSRIRSVIICIIEVNEIENNV